MSSQFFNFWYQRCHFFSTISCVFTAKFIICNLLNNATDASPDNLDIRLDWDAQWIRLTIRDHGAGVPLAIAEQIGRPFITTKGKGFGLGLFLSQASVTRAGGTVKLYNHEEGGTLTELRLPHGSVRA